MARKQPKLTIPAPKKQDLNWAVVGIDASVSSISVAALVYDALLDKIKGPGTRSLRWLHDSHFLDRLAQAVRAENLIHDAMSEAAPGLAVNTASVWIGVEEAWPAGIVRKAESRWLRQQAMMIGAVVGGLSLRKYSNLYEVNAQLWKNPIREELGVGRPDKWDVKKWALDAFELPDLPDLIKTKNGVVPQPAKSKAKPYQPDDIYDACGIMEYVDSIRQEETS